VRQVSFIGNQIYQGQQLEQLLELRPGEAGSPEFNVAKMNTDVVALRELYGGQGFIFANIVEGGTGVTRREVALNRLSVRTGDLINVQEIRNSERRLGAANIFATGGAQGGSAPRIVLTPADGSAGPRTAGRPSGGGGSASRSPSGGGGSASRPSGGGGSGSRGSGSRY